MKSISTDCYTNGVSNQKYLKRDLSILLQKKRKNDSKNAKEIISNVSKEEGFIEVVEDESIFIHDAVVRRRMLVPEGKHPIVVATGSHQKTSVFEALCIDARRQIPLPFIVIIGDN